MTAIPLKMLTQSQVFEVIREVVGKRNYFQESSNNDNALSSVSIALSSLQKNKSKIEWTECMSVHIVNTSVFVNACIPFKTQFEIVATFVLKHLLKTKVVWCNSTQKRLKG